jgi:hypothetical protein
MTPNKGTLRATFEQVRLRLRQLDGEAVFKEFLPAVHVESGKHAAVSGGAVGVTVIWGNHGDRRQIPSLLGQRQLRADVAPLTFASGATTTPSRQRISAFWTPCEGKRRQLATIGAGRPSAAKPGPRATSVSNRRTSLPENASAPPGRRRWLPTTYYRTAEGPGASELPGSRVPSTRTPGRSPARRVKGEVPDVLPLETPCNARSASATSFIMTAPICWSSFERTRRGRPPATRSP